MKRSLFPVNNTNLNIFGESLTKWIHTSPWEYPEEKTRYKLLLIEVLVLFPKRIDYRRHTTTREFHFLPTSSTEQPVIRDCQPLVSGRFPSGPRNACTIPFLPKSLNEKSNVYERSNGICFLVCSRLIL